MIISQIATFDFFFFATFWIFKVLQPTKPEGTQLWKGWHWHGVGRISWGNIQSQPSFQWFSCVVFWGARSLFQAMETKNYPPGELAEMYRKPTNTCFFCKLSFQVFFGDPSWWFSISISRFLNLGKTCFWFDMYCILFKREIYTWTGSTVRFRSWQFKLAKDPASWSCFVPFCWERVQNGEYSLRTGKPAFSLGWRNLHSKSYSLQAIRSISCKAQVDLVMKNMLNIMFDFSFLPYPSCHIFSKPSNLIKVTHAMHAAGCHGPTLRKRCRSCACGVKGWSFFDDFGLDTLVGSTLGIRKDDEQIQYYYDIL